MVDDGYLIEENVKNIKQLHDPNSETRQKQWTSFPFFDLPNSVQLSIQS